MSRRRLPIDGLSIEPDPVNSLLESGKSLLRWGDGETRVLLGGDIAFQRSEPGLRRALLAILTSPPDESRFELALPHQPFLPEPAFRALKRPRLWRETRRTLPLLVDPRWITTQRVIESNAFRTSSETPLDERPLDPGPLIRQTECFVLVGPEKVIDRIRTAFPGHEIHAIRVPPRNAYRAIDGIIAGLDRLYASSSFDGRTPTIVSAGPAGKVIVHARAERWTLYDLGHFHQYLPRIPTVEG